MEAKIFYNPDCNTCRTTMGLLRSANVDAEVVEYLKEPPSAEQIKEILALLGVGPRALLRTKEPAYREEGLDDLSIDDDAIITAMVKHPVLIQRPIVIANGKAVIGRPPEKVFDIL